MVSKKWEGVESSIGNTPICKPPHLKPLTFANRHIVRPSGTPSSMLDFLEPDTFNAANAGTVVHKIIEKCWKNLNESACIQKWIDVYDVPNQWKNRIVKMAQAFQKSPHYQKVIEGAEAYFEYDYTYVNTEGRRVYGSIDLLYFDEESKGWVIVDFKTTALNGLTHEEVMKMHGYDKQLNEYACYVESVQGKGSVTNTEVCWLWELAKNQ